MTIPLPETLCLYAVGDVHGRADLLMGLLHRIQAHAATLPRHIRPEVIMLGDYVDRGPYSAQTLDLLTTGLGPHLRLTCLKGNHEEMMLAAVHDPHSALVERWLANGGVETLASYGLRSDQVHQLEHILPPLHRQFLENLPTAVTRGDYLFVHAGIDPRRQVDDQDEQAMLWIRDPFLSHQESFGKIVVHGHTIVAHPEHRHNRIAVDTGAYRSLCLSAAVLQGDYVDFLQEMLPDHRALHNV